MRCHQREAKPSQLPLWFYSSRVHPEALPPVRVYAPTVHGRAAHGPRIGAGRPQHFRRGRAVYAHHVQRETSARVLELLAGGWHSTQHTPRSQRAGCIDTTRWGPRAVVQATRAHAAALCHSSAPHIQAREDFYRLHIDKKKKGASHTSTRARDGDMGRTCTRAGTGHSPRPETEPRGSGALRAWLREQSQISVSKSRRAHYKHDTT
jgi:hypothetical protein